MLAAAYEQNKIKDGTSLKELFAAISTPKKDDKKQRKKKDDVDKQEQKDSLDLGDAANLIVSPVDFLDPRSEIRFRKDPVYERGKSTFKPFLPTLLTLNSFLPRFPERLGTSMYHNW